MSLLGRLRWLVGGAGVAGVLGLLGVLVAARTLDAHAFGLLAIGQGLAVALRFVTFQPWQALVRYLPHSPRPGDLIGAAVLLDHLCAAGAALAFLGLLATAPGSFGLTPAEAVTIAPLAGGIAVLAFDPWVGVLLTRNRQDLVARVQVVSSAIRLGGLLWAAGVGGGLAGFVVAHVLGDLAWAVGMVWAAWGELPAVPRMSLKGLLAAHPGLGRLLWSTAGTSLLTGASTQADVPLVAMVAGPAVAGQWRLVRSLANTGAVLAGPLRQAFLAHAVAGGAVGRASLLILAGGGALVLGVLVLGEALLPLIVGPAIHGLVPALAWALAGVAALLAAIPLSAGHVAVGREYRVLWVTAAAVPAYLAAIACWGQDPTRVALAFALQQGLMLVALEILRGRGTGQSTRATPGPGAPPGSAPPAGAGP